MICTIFAHSKKETFPRKSTVEPRPGDIWNGRLDGDKEEAGPTFRMLRCPVNPWVLTNESQKAMTCLPLFTR